MKGLKYIVAGILFGIVMTKSEAISWYRIQEMFMFESIHMYGIIGVSVILGILMVLITKKMKFNNYNGVPIVFVPKSKSVPRYLFGGIIFGLGWSLTGTCPGPMYTLLGHGLPIMLIVIASALLGTLTYGALRSKLPH